MATLPPSQEGLTICIFQARTSRQNVVYQVFQLVLGRGVPRDPHQWLVSSPMLDFICWQIQHARGGRVIIYTNTKSQAQALSQELGCEAYHSRTMDHGGVLQQFMDRVIQVIVATSALGMGLDIPDIQYVMHMGRPRILLDYGQESRRAGRDGLASEAVIIQPSGWETLDPWMADVPAGEFEQYLDGTVDGYTRQQCQNQDTGKLACNGCDPKWEDHKAPMTLIAKVSQVQRARSASSKSIQSQVRRARSVSSKSIQSQVQRARSVSSKSIQSQVPQARPIAHIPSPAHGPPVPVLEFEPVWFDRAAIQVEAAWRQAGLNKEQDKRAAQQWQDQYYTCAWQGRDDKHDLYSCHAADNQMVCHGWEGGGCQYRGILIPIVAQIVYGPGQKGVQQAWHQQLAADGINIRDQGSIIKWLGQGSGSGWSHLFKEFY
ncbi:hypothetical protein BJX76DRAFT_367216 [Aspergillus varians]